MLPNWSHIPQDSYFQHHTQFSHPSSAMYIFMSHYQNEELNHNRASENAANLKYLRMTVTNSNYIHR